MTRGVVAVVSLGLLLGAGGVRGQSLELSAAGGFHALGGDDFDGTDSGFGGEVVARYLVGYRLSLGAGFLRNHHRLDAADARYAVPAVFVEPRYAFGEGDGSLQPFVAVRAGWVRQSLRLSGPDRVADGFGLGVTAGVQIPVSTAWGVEAGANAYQAWFGDFQQGGATISGSTSSGQTYGVRLGLYWRGG